MAHPAKMERAPTTATNPTQSEKARADLLAELDIERDAEPDVEPDVERGGGDNRTTER